MGDQKNPTCDVRTYVGGQIACHHMFSLLDADQDIPWPDQPLEYHLKMRFWYQDYDESYHTNVKRTTWGIASPVEYDVPKCAKDVAGCSKDENGNWISHNSWHFQGPGQPRGGTLPLPCADMCEHQNVQRLEWNTWNSA